MEEGNEHVLPSSFVQRLGSTPLGSTPTLIPRLSSRKLVFECISGFVEAIRDAACHVFSGACDGIFRVIEEFAEDVADLNDAFKGARVKTCDRMVLHLREAVIVISGSNELRSEVHVSQEIPDVPIRGPRAACGE